MKNKKFTRCFNCKYYVSKTKEYKDQNRGYIGFCSEYDFNVIDTLCGCEIKDGTIIARNFNPKEG